MTPERLAEIHEHDRRDRERGSISASVAADIADHRAELLAEVARLTRAQDRVWAIVGQRRESARAAGLDPYADPIAQALAAALTDSPEPAPADHTTPGRNQ